ncbi:hypothetical protein KIF59_08135 [Enterobacter cloacae subsp. cloacae]|nr:hypothetical protein [Enterobacter cloacae subsp. cloacae]
MKKITQQNDHGRAGEQHRCCPAMVLTAGSLSAGLENRRDQWRERGRRG